ncbi:MAG: type II toxin-antitoxin system Phd/YefM family antitoxin [Chlamydiae bacterium]|nr:type II toxin-antitoxin system Phd/YefM family antitoxin [Chlamydiota bacterium]
MSRKGRTIRYSHGRHETWQLQEAKARFSELVDEVIEGGYHTITKNGRPVVVIISHEEFEKIYTPKNTLGEFLSESPFSTFDLDIERNNDLGREIDLCTLFCTSSSG